MVARRTVTARSSSESVPARQSVARAAHHGVPDADCDVGADVEDAAVGEVDGVVDGEFSVAGPDSVEPVAEVPVVAPPESGAVAALDEPPLVAAPEFAPLGPPFSTK